MNISLNLLDANRELIHIIDTYESLLWTKKYQDVGGCVVVLAPTTELISLLKTEAKYISRDDDDMVCEIKKIGLTLDNTSKKYTLTITGLGSETLLNQRIVWSQTNISDTAEMFIRRLVLNNFKSNDNRGVDFIQLGGIKNYPERISKQVTYDDLLTVIKDVCKTYDLGFRFIKTSNNMLVFDLYRGLDCSQSQDTNDHITFSADFNNLLSFDWELDLSGFKNVCLVGGEGEGIARKTKVVGNAIGIDRYETFADAKSLSSEGEEGTIINYDDVLTESGNEVLATNTVKESFSCKIDVEQYQYKVDYDLGYKVTVVGEYGLQIDAKIIEIVECNDNNGYRITANLEI